jgi:tetratricopeptide (TPR) repeat protein
MKSISFLLLVFCLAAISSASGQDSSYWQAQALSDHQNGSSDLALEDIDQYLALEPDDLWAWSFKANLLKEMKQYSEAVGSFDQIIRIDPGNAQAYNDRALLLSGGLNQHDDALESIKTAVEINPENANYYFNMGIILEAQEGYDEALQSYSQATILNPSLAVAWYRQGMVYKDLGKLNESVSFLSRALDLDANNADAWNEKGLALMDLGSRDEAISCFERAAAIEPSNLEFQNNLEMARSGSQMQLETVMQFNSTS